MKRRTKIPNSTLGPEKRAMELEIRQYTPADKEMVQKINQLSLEISFHYYYDVFHDRDPELFLIAEYREKIVGFIMVKNGINLGESPTALIYAVAVSPQYRSRGIGAQLVNAICKILEQKQIKKFFLHVRTENMRAISFYENLGFTTIKVIKKFYSWGEDATRMLKLIEF